MSNKQYILNLFLTTLKKTSLICFFFILHSNGGPCHQTPIVIYRNDDENVPVVVAQRGR